MKYCTHCGAEIDDDAIICIKCGCLTESFRKANENSTKSTMRLIAYILSLITTIITGFALIPLAWCIPMTMKIYRAYKNNEDLSVWFKVCSLIFLNFVVGILLLVENE